MEFRAETYSLEAFPKRIVLSVLSLNSEILRLAAEFLSLNPKPERDLKVR